MRRCALAALLVSLVGLAPATATANFHLVSLREVFPGDAGQADAEYVQMQAYAAGQNFLAGHTLTFRNAAGAVIGTESFDADVSDGRSQMTFVMATPAAEARFGIAADEGMASDLLDPAGGAVCWEALDCVSWGTFAGSLPSPAGSPATPAGIPAAMALRRTIAPGCATLLELLDDSDNSAVDFSAVFPAPRPNSTAPSERLCTSATVPVAGPEGPSRRGAPQTRLRRRPPARTRDRTPTFRFSSTTSSSFECRLDGRRFKPCRSPFTTRRLPLGRHTFQVRARDSSGEADPTPAFDAFRVVRRLG
jgi:hypothetical protein